jgi:hypothetical protein
MVILFLILKRKRIQIIETINPKIKNAKETT